MKKTVYCLFLSLFLVLIGCSEDEPTQKDPTPVNPDPDKPVQSDDTVTPDYIALDWDNVKSIINVLIPGAGCAVSSDIVQSVPVFYACQTDFSSS